MAWSAATPHAYRLKHFTRFPNGRLTLTCLNFPFKSALVDMPQWGITTKEKGSSIAARPFSL
jgi:hypothetical protein